MRTVFSYKIGSGLGSRLVLVVFPRSRLCPLHENDNTLSLEMSALTVRNGNDRLTKGKFATARHFTLCSYLCSRFRNTLARHEIYDLNFQSSRTLKVGDAIILNIFKHM